MVELPDFIANYVDLPECAVCERRFDDDSYDELGNLIARTSGEVAVSYIVVFALAPVIAASEGPILLLAKAAEKSGRDDLAENIRDFSFVHTGADKFFEHLDSEWEDVQWIEKDGEPVCYMCKNNCAEVNGASE